MLETKYRNLKVYRVRIDLEDKNGYCENVTNYTLLSESYDEVIEMAKNKIKSEKEKEKKFYVIGEVELVCLID